MLANVFVKDPIIINIWSKEQSKWNSSRLIIVGPHDDPNIRKKLDSMAVDFNSNRKVKDNKLITELYGKNWKSKLGMVVSGGENESSFTEEDILDASDIKLPKTDHEPSVDIEKLKVPEELTVQDLDVEPIAEGDAISYVDLEKGTSTTEIEEPVSLEITADDLTTTISKDIKPDQPLKKNQIKFVYDLILFPEDKISEVKHKINLYLKIPIFRQHLWYTQSGQSFPLKYSFSQGGAIMDVDMNSVLHPTAGTKVENICEMPINMFLYHNKDTVKIKAYDDFTLIGNIYLKTGVTEYNLVDLESFVAPFRSELVEINKNDKYQLHMLYYGFIVKYFPQMNIAAFAEYIDERTLKSSYPQLEPNQDDLAFLPKQQMICNELYELYETNEPRVAKIDQSLHKSLTETTLKISSNVKRKIINLRILFDLFELDPDHIDAIKLFDVYEGKHIILDKYLTADTKRSQEKLIPGVLYFRVLISQKPYQRLNLFLYPNGSYAIRGVWGEDQNYEFSDVNMLVDKHINPIIKKINSMASQVMYYGSNMYLNLVEKNNVKFIDISISLFWKKILSTGEFKQLKIVLDSFVAARLIIEKQVDKNIIQYFFKKGMHEFDPERIEKTAIIDNYYAYLFNSDIRQKWFMLFDQVRVMTVTHRFSDIKIELSGVKEDEYYIFIRYIVLLFSTFMRDRKADSSNQQDLSRITKPLSNLKEQDPHLYNFKKIYNSEIVYSKICQKPYQPLLLTQQQYDRLDKNKKDNITRYWNFTTSTDAFYQCPNPKYPHVRFIIGKHPMGYCIPCCKITPPPTNPGDKQRIIYDKCIQDHIFAKKDVERSTSRYIMSYGKSIDIGRLSHLPEQSLEPLFYETKIEESSEEDNDTVLGSKYYLYGVPQNHPKIQEIGLIYCFSHSTGMNIENLIELVIKKIEIHADNFQMLLGGTITNWFLTAKHLTDALRELFITGVLPKNTKFTAWNDLIIDIGLQFLDIYCIIFEDRDTVIQLRLPNYLDNIEDMQYPKHRHLIVLHNLATNYWNPIYVIHKDLYFRAGIIDRKLFNYQSDTIQIVMDMIKTKFKDSESNVASKSNRITFDVIRRFVDQKTSKYKIKQLLVTRDNLCYGIQIDSDVGFIPIHLSHFKFEETLDISFESKDLRPGTLKAIKEFINKYNMWVAHESEHRGFIKVDVPVSKPLLERIEPIWPIIEIERYLVYGNNVIAFMSHGLNFYIQPTAISKIKDAKFQKLIYNPLEVNSILEAGESLKNKDERTEMLNGALYKNYIYQILVLEFIQLFNKYRNIKIRESLKRLILKTDFKKPTKTFIDAMTEIITHGFGTDNLMLLADVEKIKSQLTENVQSGANKKTLMEAIELENYAFDMIMIEKLKKLPKRQILDQLHKLAEGIVQIKPGKVITTSQFPNILSSCGDTALGYCDAKTKKLLITRADLDRYLDVLSDQIKNPFVEKYLFSPLFQNSIIDYFKFTKREGETIEIEFI